MTEKIEIPGVCKEYDDIEDEILIIKQELEELFQNKNDFTDQLKEAINIVKKAKEAGKHSEYYSQKIDEIDLELLLNKRLTNEKNTKIEELKLELNEKEQQVKAGHMIKIHTWGLFETQHQYEWISEEEYKNTYEGKGFNEMIV